MKEGMEGSRDNVYKCIMKEPEPNQIADNSSENFGNVVISLFLKFTEKYDQKHIKNFPRERKSPTKFLARYLAP